MSRKVVTIVGARPQFVKLAPFSREVRKAWQEVIVHTGQHYDTNMSGSFFTDLGIPEPDYQLASGGGGHGAQTGRMLEAVEKVLLDEKPDVVVVFGDTNSTVAGALAAAKLQLPVAHVEAGLRSFNRAMPEEINRIVADHTSDLLFAPTSAAMANLRNEGLEKRARLTGDIMVDAVLSNRARAEERSGILGQLELKPGEYSLLTLHRPYTVDDPDLLSLLLRMLEEMRETILFPVHPRTRQTLMRTNFANRLQSNGSGSNGRLRFIEPMGYLDFLCLENHAKRILTDSGGIQKEAYILRKPCVTLRTETEWIETVEEGWNLLLPPDTVGMVEQIEQFRPPAEQAAVFGETVAAKIVDSLKEFMPAEPLIAVS